MIPLNRFTLTAALALLVCTAKPLAASPAVNASPTAKETQHQQAATLFVERCSLCHGNDAMGEGLLPLKIKDYPPTNIYHTRRFTQQQELVQLISEGIPGEDLKHYMPPWKGELNESEIAMLADFIVFLREDLDSANRMLVAATQRVSPGGQGKISQHGAALFETRCVLCHGSSGGGDGRMAKIIKNPPPANLQTSVVPFEYITLIVSRGGAALNRSAQMPPWSDQLTEQEIQAVAKYVMGLRKATATTPPADKGEAGRVSNK